MPIIRCSSQKSMTLEEFYSEMVDSRESVSNQGGQGMLLLIEMINNTFKETTIWGLTSLARLVLLNRDDWRSNWFVTIGSLSDKEYFFEYLMPLDQRPWPNATIHGEAKSIEEARQYLLIAMTQCEGWKDNQELMRLAKEYNIK